MGSGRLLQDGLASLQTDPPLSRESREKCAGAGGCAGAGTCDGAAVANPVSSIGSSWQGHISLHRRHPTVKNHGASLIYLLKPNTTKPQVLPGSTSCSRDKTWVGLDLELPACPNSQQINSKYLLVRVCAEEKLLVQSCV